MRLIDGDALEELFREVIGSIAKKPEMDGSLEHMVRASAMVIEMIKDAPTIEQEQKWIPVSKELPKTNVLVWVTDLHQHVSACQLYTDISDWYSESDEWMYKHDSIIAWKPYIVPEPYNGGDPG